MARSNGNSPAPATEPNVLTWYVLGEPFAADWESFPIDNRIAMFKRAVKHALQNEVAASAAAVVVAELDIGKLTRDEKQARLAQYREENAETWKEIVLDKANERWTVLLEGTISADDRVRVDPYVRFLNEFTDKEIASRFKGAKGPDGKALKAPTNDTDVVEFANGARFTRQMLRDKVLSDPIGDTIRANATKAADAMKSTPKVAAPVTEPVSDPSALGF